MKFESLASFENPDGSQTSRFRLKSLKKGQGITIANPLRRILLTEIEGSAISEVRICGMNNEFGHLTGIREDLLEIILNLKQIRIEGLVKSPYLTCIDIEGPNLVTGSNIILPENLRIINSDQYIASIGNDTVFKLEIKIESGKGYNMVSMNKYKESSEFFPIDTIFTPITNVSYAILDVDSYGGEELEDLDMIISTDGSITPEYALICAAQHLKILFGSLGIRNPIVFEDTDDTIEPEIPIEELELSVRAFNCLKRADILTINDLSKFKVKELKQIRSFGNKCATEVVEKLRDLFNIDLDYE